MAEQNDPEVAKTSDIALRGQAKSVSAVDPRIIFCNKGYINVPENDEFIQFAFACDEIIIDRFALHPKHAKRFLMLLKKVIKEYEQRNGELKTELPAESL